MSSTFIEQICLNEAGVIQRPQKDFSLQKQKANTGQLLDIWQNFYIPLVLYFLFGFFIS